MQLAPLARLEHGATEERLDPELDAVGAVARRCRRRKVPSWSQPPRNPATSSAPVASRRAVTSSLRSSPSSAGAQSAWCMPIGSDRTPVGRVGSWSIPKVATAGRRPRLVAVPEHAQGLHDGSSRATTATASTATGASARFATDHVKRSARGTTPPRSRQDPPPAHRPGIQKAHARTLSDHEFYPRRGHPSARDPD